MNILVKRVVICLRTLVSREAACFKLVRVDRFFIDRCAKSFAIFERQFLDLPHIEARDLTQSLHIQSFADAER